MYKYNPTRCTLNVHLGGLFPAYDEGRHWKKFINDIETNDEEFF
jgi:hypothetical protein